MVGHNVSAEQSVEGHIGVLLGKWPDIFNAEQNPNLFPNLYSHFQSMNSDHSHALFRSQFDLW
jgi:hypothetical protein